MQPHEPSRTARGAAALRALHQTVDQPRIFEDPLAVRILEGLPELTDPEARGQLEDATLKFLRAGIALRSRYAEDALGEAVGRGVRQYVVLGAGLDTFAYRNPYAVQGLRVFEVDHAATQQWKRDRLSAVGIALPDTLTFVAVDFEHDTLAAALVRSGFDLGRPAFFSWLGVTAYLTRDAVMSTLRFVCTGLAAGSEIVFSYTREAAPQVAAHTAKLGEPFKTHFDPPELVRELRAMGFARADDLPPDEANRRYFAGRADDLRVGPIGHLMRARV
jgi:methyltransferase (TIGR00027 family)